MNNQTYQTLLVTIATTLTIIITSCVSAIYWHHEAAVHHAGHYEANAWGLVSYHWNDEEAQILIVDPADRLTPPPAK